MNKIKREHNKKKKQKVISKEKTVISTAGFRLIIE